MGGCGAFVCWRCGLQQLSGGRGRRGGWGTWHPRNNSRSLASPPPPCLVFLASLICSVTVAGGEGNGGARGSLFGSWDPEGRGGALS